MEEIRIIFSEEVRKFLSEIEKEAAQKMRLNITRVALGERNIEIFKKLKNTDIWEFRAQYNGISYRILAFWDPKRRALILTTHGFIKKTDKTSKKEIKRAEMIMKKYLNNE